MFEHLIEHYDAFRNEDPENIASWVTIQVNTEVFNADKGKEAILREMVSTVGQRGSAGEHVRCIVSVNMLSEGWDVKSVSHMIGFRAFGSPLLTEQVIGRGLRRTDYSVLYEPLEERGDGAYETVDAFGIPFLGFPVQRTRRRHRKAQPGETPVPIEPEKKKHEYRVTVPNVRSWAVAVNRPLPEVIDIKKLRPLILDPKKTPPGVLVAPVIGQGADVKITLDAFRKQAPVSMIEMKLAAELFRRTSSDNSPIPGTGPTYEELLELVRAFIRGRVQVEPGADVRDVWIDRYYFRVLDTLETAVKGTPSGLQPVPILDDPPHLDTGLVRFRWVGLRAAGRKCHLSEVACDSPLEIEFANFLDSASDVLRYVKNERFGFSVTYFEGGRPRQYHPDFVAVSEEAGLEHWTVIETKGEVWPNTDLKRQAAEKWCQLMTEANEGHWTYLFVHQPAFARAHRHGVRTLADLRVKLYSESSTQPHPSHHLFDDGRISG